MEKTGVMELKGTDRNQRKPELGEVDRELRLPGQFFRAISEQCPGVYYRSGSLQLFVSAE